MQEKIGVVVFLLCCCVYGVAMTSGTVYLTEDEINNTILKNGTIMNVSMQGWGRYSLINTENTTIAIKIVPSENLKDIICTVPNNATLLPNYHIGVDVYFANDSRCLAEPQNTLKNLSKVERIDGYIDNLIGVGNTTEGMSIILNMRKLISVIPSKGVVEENTTNSAPVVYNNQESSTDSEETPIHLYICLAMNILILVGLTALALGVLK